MTIIDRAKNTIINLEGSWHMTLTDKDVWIFPSLDTLKEADSNYYKFNYENIAREELMSKFANKVSRFNLNKDVEVIM